MCNLKLGWALELAPGLVSASGLGPVLGLVVRSVLALALGLALAQGKVLGLAPGPAPAVEQALGLLAQVPAGIGSTMDSKSHTHFPPRSMWALTNPSRHTAPIAVRKGLVPEWILALELERAVGSEMVAAMARQR